MPIALYSLFLATFCIGTTEFVITGLLPDISRDLGVSIPMAGFLVSGYAIGVAIGGPLIALATARLPRKANALVLMGLFIVGHLWCALAPSYEWLMAARIFVSLSHGSFFGIAAIIGVGLVPAEKRGAAMAMVIGGITVANVLGVPGGTAIGQMFGWRTTFWVVGGFAIVATLVLAAVLPSDGADRGKRPALGAQLRALGNAQVVLAYAMIFVMMLAFWSTFTFIAPFLIEVTGVPAAQVPILLFLFGIGATGGVFAGGRLFDWRPRHTLIFAYPAQTAIFVLIYLVSGRPLVTAVAILIFGIVQFIPGSGLGNRVLQGASAAPELASTLMSSVFNFGIAGGASLGAAALAGGFAYAQLPLFGIALAVLATGLAFLAVALERRALPERQPPGPTPRALP